MRHSLPLSVARFWSAFETQRDPAWIPFRGLIQICLAHPNPRGQFRLGLAHLKRKRAAFSKLAAWLARPDVAERALLTGASWALRIWRREISNGLAGAKINQLFGMAAPGHPFAESFSMNENLAAYVLDRQQVGDKVGQIMWDIRNVLGQAAPDQRTIRYGASRISWMCRADIGVMADDTRKLLWLP